MDHDAPVVDSRVEAIQAINVVASCLVWPCTPVLYGEWKTATAGGAMIMVKVGPSLYKQALPSPAMRVSELHTVDNDAPREDKLNAVRGSE